MADFIVNLWESIFTPGPTPTLLIAANATFGALQALLLVLFVCTYSIHFAILSFLSGGLWYAINWFARELRLHAADEERKERLAAETPVGPTDDSDTEVEGVVTSGRKPRSPKPSTAAGSSQVETAGQKEMADLKRRVAAAAESGAENNGTEETQSSVSTEDEWEKVSEAENEKDK